jgi:MFS family permease
MAVLLNELFFPPTDVHTAAIISAFAFCSTYILRPFGALIFGWIGDNIGRKPTVVMTTMLMSISCVIMANLPTYAQMGITATYLITACRMIQALSSMGEVMGAKVYITEITHPPLQYACVSLVVLAASLGTMFALGIASLVTQFGFNWRIAFWMGAGISVIGSLARTKLRETPEFIDMKKKIQAQITERNIPLQEKINIASKIKNYMYKQKVNKKDFLAYSFIECGWPFAFYLSYMYFSPILKSFGYSTADVISQNFVLSVLTILSDSLLIYLSLKFHPLKILKVKGTLFLGFGLILPILLQFITNPYQVFCIQAILLMTPLAPIPGDSIFISQLPVYNRFTTATMIYALSRSIIYIVTAFGLVFLTHWFGAYGIWFILLPISGGFLWGVYHFEKLQKELKVHHQ